MCLGAVNFKVGAKKWSWLVRYSVILDQLLSLSTNDQILQSPQSLPKCDTRTTGGIRNYFKGVSYAAKNKLPYTPKSDRSVSDHSQVRLFRIVTPTHESDCVASKSSRIRRCSPTIRRHLHSFSWISKSFGSHRLEIVHVYLCLYTVICNI
jgi:hypothetical protein